MVMDRAETASPEMETRAMLGLQPNRAQRQRGGWEVRAVL
jgi:hypothetical protein